MNGYSILDILRAALILFGWILEPERTSIVFPAPHRPQTLWLRLRVDYDEPRAGWLCAQGATS